MQVPREASNCTQTLFCGNTTDASQAEGASTCDDVPVCYPCYAEHPVVVPLPREDNTVSPQSAEVDCGA